MTSTDDDNAQDEGREPDEIAAGVSEGPGHVKRRTFLDAALGLTGAAAFGSAVYPVIEYFTPVSGTAVQSGMVTVGRLDAFPVNTAKTIELDAEPVIVVRDKDGNFHAASAVCTHLGCVIGYDTATGQLSCACHHGTFALSGRPLAGPPPRPLRMHSVSVLGDNVVVSAS